MLVAACVIFAFENTAAIYERRGLFQLMFFAGSAVALSGPLAATIGQFFPERVGTYLGKEYKATGLEDF
jgi:hypothetical protein